MRTYYLYAKPSGRYEVIPRGFSAFAFFLGPIWAAANGLIIELFFFVGLFSVPLFVFVSYFSESAPLFFTGLLIQFAAYVYFISIAYKLRARDLERHGFKRLAEIESTSIQAALRDWSQSKEGAHFLEEGTPNGPITRM